MLGSCAMFDLMAAIAGSEKQIFTPDMAKVAKTAKPKETRELSLAKPWLKLAKADSELKENQEVGEILASLSHPLANKEPSKGNEFSQISHFSQPCPFSFDFLKETVFTEAMIKEGVRLWQEPFDQDDFDNLKTGMTTIEKAKDYLILWSKQHPDKFQALKEACQTVKTITESASKDSLETLTSQGLKLLGEDRLFINQNLLRYPMSRRKEIINQCAIVWQEAAKSEPIEHKKANKARRTANTWLWKTK
jgi:hypothetical protein